jgi:trk/ktr system potassium uptake protein
MLWQLRGRNIVDSFILSGDYTIMEVNAPEKFYEKTVESIDFRKNFSVDLVTIKRTFSKKGVLGIGKSTSEEILGLPSSDIVIMEGDVLVLFGAKKAIDRMIRE